MKTLLLILLVVSANAQNISSEAQAKLQHRVVKGYDCTSSEFPYLATIAALERQFCGCSLIDPKWVLTAAHCCEEMKQSLEYFEVKVGESRWNEDYEQKSKIASVFMHPSYGMANALSADCCLIQLVSEIRPSPRVKVNTLATLQQYRSLILNGECRKIKVMGFGSRDPVYARTAQHGSYRAQCASLELIPQRECERLEPGLFDYTTFCALSPEGRDTCQGDSGGPVFCGDIQVGIVSSGRGCGSPGDPGFYCRVDIFQEFIKYTMDSWRMQKRELPRQQEEEKEKEKEQGEEEMKSGAASLCSCSVGTIISVVYAIIPK